MKFTIKRILVWLGAAVLACAVYAVFMIGICAIGLHFVGAI